MPYPAGPAAPGQWREGFFDSKDGLRLFEAARVLQAPKAVVAIVHGYADHCLRYRHVMDALGAAGFSSYAFDYRGHGQAAGRRGYVSAFSDYLTDLSVFLGRVRAENPAAPLFVVAHSHGCLVTGMAFTEPDARTDIAGCIFSSPYYKLRIQPSAFQLFQAKVVGRLIPFLPVKNPLTVQMLTTDPAFQKASDEDPLRHHVVTPRWFTESNNAQATLLGRAGNFKLPLLLLVGGSDPVADPAGGRQFYDAVGSTDRQFISYDGMLHEIFNETDRARPIGDVINWLQVHTRVQAAA